MQQQQPEHNISGLLKIPQAYWARNISVILILLVFWQFFTGGGNNVLFSIMGLVVLLIVANLFEQQQRQIQSLQQQLFDLQQHLSNLPAKDQIFSDTTQAITTGQASAKPLQSAPTLHGTEDQLADESIQSNEISTINPKPLSDQVVVPVMVSQPRDDADALKELKAVTSLWHTAIDWFKGGNSIVRIAIVVLLIGVVLLLRFASEYWQLTLSARMAAIAAGGFALTALGYVLRKKRFEYAISLQGAGLGIVFLVLFSAFHLHVIASISLAYVSLIALLAATLVLALRQNALILAFIALGSGFVAPFILNTGSNNVAAMMAYYFVLNSALAVIAWFKPWRILNTVALLMTFGIGGFAVWFNAEPEQYFQISCWVWLIFALYLFISIRYSQLIIQFDQKFSDIPFIDSTLIFATPFMAFSLYAGLVDSDGQALSIASAILAVVYLSIGFVLHRRVHQLTILAQCFYGLGLVFLALILPFAFDAYWSSVGWAIHGAVVLYLGWRYNIINARYFGTALLLASGIATLYAGVLDQRTVLFASSVLMVSYAFAAYCLRYALQTRDRSAFEQVFSILFMTLSFAIVPYVYQHTVAHLSWQMNFVSLPLLLWFLLLSGWYWLKHKIFDQTWSLIGFTILVLSTLLTLIHVIDHTDLLVLYQLNMAERYQLFWVSLLWLAGFSVFIQSENATTTSARIWQNAILATLAVFFLGALGAVWSNSFTSIYLWTLVPIVVFAITLFVERYQGLQSYWVGNPGIIVIGLLWLCYISALHNGQWDLPYVMLLNPIDLSSLLLFAIITYAIRPFLIQGQRELQIVSAASILFVGLFLISSLLLRVLYHYADLPYWSQQAWVNSTVQTCLTILWTSVALVLTSLASRKSWRYIWMLGIAVLALVILKLIFLDLSHSHTLTRIVSFIGSGLIMLVIGYFAPLPPKAKSH
ncbi:MAG: DUF2339 domain-containing protein [Acinetobacter populi]|jgi:uncharacterized membrane protein|uniref:DUF2339 domain-containing protein n=1 Tax=Acinetobacter populi TaxID=1582270 RepID=UPI0023536BFD|nr:DUF2339 domain-containing protein [Acinetobacter populi]MCH4246297.1 DUF2339 domain-containing protein [Acinetobacter populi]